MGNDTEVWLLFAPFWLLGIAALIGSAWHMAHAAIVTRRAQAAGQDLHGGAFEPGLAVGAGDGHHHARWP